MSPHTRRAKLFWAALCALACALLALVPVWMGTSRAGKDVSADETLVVFSPHPENVRAEIGEAFARDFHARTGRTVSVQWRVPGGTQDIIRYLDAQYAAAFRRYWTQDKGRVWSAAVQNGFAKDDPQAPADVRDARAAFLNSAVSVGGDVLFGGGNYEAARQAARGQLVSARVMRAHPEWFAPQVMPETFGGERLRDAQGRWFGVVLSRYGIIYNAERLRALGLPPPARWADLADPRYFGAVALADPTKSGSSAKCFEMIFQQQMAEAPTPAEGWMRALHLVQAICANARYFTDAAGRPNLEVASGDCAAGMAIDFYAEAQRAQIEARNPQAPPRFFYVTPAHGSALTADPVGILRGAPHRETAETFVEFLLSAQGQRLWNTPSGAPGGPARAALGRLPVRMDAYAPGGENPYRETSGFVYRPEWTGKRFDALRTCVRVVGMDTHEELRAAAQGIARARAEGRTADAQAAQAVLADLRELSYDAMGAQSALWGDPLARQQWIRRTDETLRARYAQALRLANGQK